MAQSAVTVTPENPTPPTNLSCVGTTPPTDSAQSYADDGWTSPGSNTTVFVAKTAAAGSGTSVDAEGKGAETSVTYTYSSSIFLPAGALVSVGAGPAYSTTPNQAHASTLTPATNPTLSTISPTSTTSGVGTIATLTCTGVGFTRQSVIYVNGVAQPTTFVSSTSLTASAVTKKTTAGTWPVIVRTGGVVDTASQTLTFS